VPQTPRYYPTAQIRQSTDRISARPVVGATHRRVRPGHVGPGRERRVMANWPTPRLSPGSVRRIAISLWQRCAPTRHTSRESRERKSGKWLVRQQPERKEKHRNGQRRANHEQRREFSKLSPTHEMQRPTLDKPAKRRETASKTLAFSFAQCNQPRSQNVSD